MFALRQKQYKLAEVPCKKVCENALVYGIASLVYQALCLLVRQDWAVLVLCVLSTHRVLTL